VLEILQGELKLAMGMRHAHAIHLFLVGGVFDPLR